MADSKLKASKSPIESEQLLTRIGEQDAIERSQRIDVLEKLCTVHLELDRSPKAKGKEAPRLPSAIVKKERLVRFGTNGHDDHPNCGLPGSCPPRRRRDRHHRRRLLSKAARSRSPKPVRTLAPDILILVFWKDRPPDPR
jgi:hypothetical protein